jgi:hypothetical protein
MPEQACEWVEGGWSKPICNGPNGNKTECSYNKPFLKAIEDFPEPIAPQRDDLPKQHVIAWGVKRSA